MNDKLSETLQTDKTYPSISGFLLILTIVGISAWIIKYNWKRRHLYWYSANIPGPPSYPLVGSGLRLMKNSTEDMFDAITQIVEEYPELFKFWLGNSLIYTVSKPEHLEIIMNSSSCLGKSDLYKYSGEVLGSGLLTAPVPVWKRHRRLIGPVFNQKLLNGFMKAFNEQGTIFLSLLDQKLDESNLDIFEMLSALNLDILGDTIMGVKLNGQRNKTKLSECLNTMMMIVFLRTASIWYQRNFLFNLSKLAKSFRYAREYARDLTKKIVVETRKASDRKLQKLMTGEAVDGKESPRRTLLDALLVLSDKGVKLTDTEIHEEVQMFLFAGTDTSALSVGFILTMLGMHQDIQEQVLKEVLDVVGPNSDIALENLSELKLMDRVIRESLRLFPVGPYMLRRTETDVHIGDAIIPADCEVMIATFRVQRNEKYWKDPLKFHPDRFLPEEVAKRHPYTYLPFSAGPRNCIGYRYAMMSMKVLLSKIVRRYVITTSYKTVDEIKLFSNLVLRAKDGYKVRFQLRE